MHFRIYQPSDLLARYIRCYWVLESEYIPGDFEMILPDGCTELIFHFGDNYLCDFGKQEEAQPNNIIVGQITNAIRLKPTGNTGIFAMRFQPWGLHLLTGIPADELRQNFFTASDVLGKDVRYLQEQMDGHDDIGKIKAVERYLLSVLDGIQTSRQASSTGHFGGIIKEIRKHKGNLSVSQLALLSNTSVRHFHRSFNRAIGLSPKQFSRIIRLQNFMGTYQPSENTLSATLHESGYYDQAHFIREFRDIAGITPSAFFKDDNEMANLMLL